MINRPAESNLTKGWNFGHKSFGNFSVRHAITKVWCTVVYNCQLIHWNLHSCTCTVAHHDQCKFSIRRCYVMSLKFSMTLNEGLAGWYGRCRYTLRSAASFIAYLMVVASSSLCSRYLITLSIAIAFKKNGISVEYWWPYSGVIWRNYPNYFNTCLIVTQLVNG